MRIIDSFEYKGMWWLPTNPDKEVAGILTYNKEKIVLELIGSFSESNTAINAFFDKKNENVIYGITSDSQEITLLNCSVWGSVNFSCPFPLTNYTCQYAIIGKYIKSIEEKAHYWAYAYYPALSYWCQPQCLETTVMFNENNKIDQTTITFQNRVGGKIINEAYIDDNTVLRLKGGVNYEGGYDGLNPLLNQHTFLEIKNDRLISLSQLLSINFQFQTFLSLAALDQVSFNEFTLFDESVFQMGKDGSKYYRPISVICSSWDKESCVNRKWEFLFDYDLIKERYPIILQKWFEDIEDIAPIRLHLIDSVRSSSFFRSVDFLIVVQALDGFCIRFRKETNLSNELTALKKEFSDIQVILRDDVDVNVTTRSRHYFSHLLSRDKKKNVVDGFELLDLTYKLRRLLVCCILSYIGIDHGMINTIFSKTNNKFIKR